MTGNPLLLLSVCAELACIQLLGLGLLGEVSARIYFETKQNRPYSIIYNSADEERSTIPFRRSA
jgi:hypothetical protein